MSVQQPFFSFASKDDETMIKYAAQDALRKKHLGIKLNYKEVGLVICWHIIEQANKGRTLKQVTDSARKLLQSNDVMIGVPEIMQRLVVNVRFKDGKNRQVIVKNPIKPGE